MNGALFGQQGQPVPGIPGAYLAPQQLAPQGIFGSLLGGPVGGFLGGALGGVFGNPNLGRQIGQTAGTIGGGFLPFNVDPMTAAYAQQAQQQLAPQGFFGDLIGHVGQPLGGAIGGWLGNQGLGNQVGGAIGQLGKFLPFNVDPMTAAYAQQAQQQLAPQGFFGNLLGQVGQPLGGAIGGLFGNQGIGSQVGGTIGQLGRFLPFNVDPLTAAYAQQAQQAQQQLAPQGFLGNLLGQLQPRIGSQPIMNPPFGQQFLPFNADPMTAAYAQQAQQQLAPQGFFGNLLGQVGQPLGGAIGGLFGNQGIGSQVGGAIGQLGKFLPFNVDPLTAAYAQQAQQAQQQLAPQGFFGNLLGQVGQPLGGAIGGLFGNQGIGSQVGGAIGQLGKFLPFNVDPIAAAYAQQQQLTPQGWLGGFLPPQFGQMISPTFPPPLQGLLNRPILGSPIGSQ